MDGSPISKVKEKKVGANENSVDASHDRSPLVVQGSSKFPSAGLNNLRFREYLVPVQLMDIQLEQYCSTLITNSGLLCSSTKKGNLDPLQDVLGALRKSQTPSSSVKNCLGIGHMLDDFICHSFGHESYVHIYTQNFVHPKEKQAAIDLFNDKTSGRFLVLTEYSSPPVSIRLACVDVVILFNSDWNPVNNIRALQRMTLHTENYHFRMLRLYSLCTLEEKALCLARDGSAVNSIRPFISTSTRQMLLTWGAAYRFDKLDALHANNTSESTKSLEDEFFNNVLGELLTLLSSNIDDTSVDCSVISKVNEVGEYALEI